MAQVASILLFKLAKTTSRIGYFMSADGRKISETSLARRTRFLSTPSSQNRVANDWRKRNAIA